MDDAKFNEFIAKADFDEIAIALLDIPLVKDEKFLGGIEFHYTGDNLIWIYQILFTRWIVKDAVIYDSYDKCHTYTDKFYAILRDIGVIKTNAVNWSWFRVIRNVDKQTDN